LPIFGAPATLAWPKPSHQNTPLGLTALCTDTVTVTDPTHPFYGLTLPLVGVTVKRGLGRVAIVWLHPGIERAIPVTGTNLTEDSKEPSPCRLSYAGIQALLAVVASLVTSCQEEAHVQPSATSATSDSAVTPAVNQLEAVIPAAATGTTPFTAPSGVGRHVADDTGPGTPRDPANSAGGVP
jgi:hypothetical protein